MREETDAVLARLREARALLSRIADGENGHLLTYADDGIDSALGYLETFRRRLDDPESD